MAVSGVDAQIADALLWAVGSMSLTPALAVAYPNVAFVPKIGTPYLQVSVIPNTTDALGINDNSSTDRQGLMQLSVFWPAGAGAIQAMQVASQIANAFRFGTRIDRNGLWVRIDKAPRVAAALQETDWLQVPVVVTWRCLTRVAA
jgi:hypothetical protein